MKELIESLNLPKQILDKTEKLMSTLFGPAAKEIGELFADRIRHGRMKNQIKIFKKTVELLESNNLEARELKLKTLVPLIEKSSLEDEEFLQNKWANLIANISTTPENGFEPKLVKTLSNLSSLEARAMDFIYEMFLKNRRLEFEKRKKWKWLNLESEEDINIYWVLIKFSDLKKKFNLTDEFTIIIVDNLESLGLIKYEEPEVEIENSTSEADVKNEDERGPYVELDIEVTANFYQSDNFNITTYGKYFVNQCRLKK